MARAMRFHSGPLSLGLIERMSLMGQIWARTRPLTTRNLRRMPAGFSGTARKYSNEYGYSGFSRAKTIKELSVQVKFVSVTTGGNEWEVIKLSAHMMLQ